MYVPELYFVKILGKGSFGTVSLYKYKSRVNGKTHYVAAKTSDEKHAHSLHREFEILSEFKGCPRIIQCCGTKVQENLTKKGCLEYKIHTEYKIHMEYASEGSLKSFMNRFKDKKLPDPMIRDFTRMILEGLSSIHGQGYVHCDLKPDNILVFPSCVYTKGERRASYELKISDFGLSRKEGDFKWWKPHCPNVGTSIYMSPESVSHGETTKGLDLWSLGCVVLQMYTGKKPWWHKKYDLSDLKKCYKPLVLNDLPCDARFFITTCFNLETEDRKDAATLLRHSFLHKIEETPLNAKKEKAKRFASDLEKIRQKLCKIINKVTILKI